MTNSFWYLATPYSKYPGGLDAAFRLACEETARLIKADVPVYSPIAHSHPVAVAGDMDPLDHSVWLPADKPMMDAASGLIVLEADGWRESYGMACEIEAFRAAGKPIVHMTPGEVPAALIDRAAIPTIIIALVGLAGSGKSVAAAHLVDRYDARVEKFAGPLKDMMRALGLTEREIEGDAKENPCDLLLGATPRHAMRTIGTEWGREMIHPDLWVSAWTRRVSARGGVVVVDDCRFVNEAGAVRALGGLIVRIERAGLAVANHKSETEMAEIVPDRVIVNDGALDYLRRALDGVVREISPCRCAA